MVAAGVRMKLSADSAFSKPSRSPLPLEQLHQVMQAVTSEIDDRHLTILDVVGQGGFGTVYKVCYLTSLLAAKACRHTPGANALSHDFQHASD